MSTQVQTIKDILDHDGITMVCKERELKLCLDKLKEAPTYIFKIAKHLRSFTGLSLSHSENMIDITQNMDIFV